jgi:hypothetical protein
MDVLTSLVVAIRALVRPFHSKAATQSCGPSRARLHIACRSLHNPNLHIVQPISLFVSCNTHQQWTAPHRHATTVVPVNYHSTKNPRAIPDESAMSDRLLRREVPGHSRRGGIRWIGWVELEGSVTGIGKGMEIGKGRGVRRGEEERMRRSWRDGGGSIVVARRWRGCQRGMNGEIAGSRGSESENTKTKGEMEGLGIVEGMSCGGWRPGTSQRQQSSTFLVCSDCHSITS